MKIVSIVVFLSLIGLYIKNEKHNQQVLKKFDTELVGRELVAHFSDKEETTDDLEDTCIQFEGSKRSLENPLKYNQKTKFIIFEKDNCVRKVTADGLDIMVPEFGEHCVNFRLPKSYCVGKGCVRKIDHCF